ncbi:hypothetical protein B1A87_001265 [Arthrobacter sp. KBS0703]|uniref:hypothetical protein n=1 Tax=Arthrobacter sp. KBS0703 TaxID=1955698 RepID=UPI00098F344A|nr:hypothetical protein [Arthrobacter sp. KBS0703]TSE14761.1 hypothetical protein B1A87_001265 [Arthrobacter sp. KBS0703]
MKRRHLAVTGLLACAAALAAAPPQPTTAAWAFPEYASGSFEAGTVLPPTWVSCVRNGVGTFIFTWANPVGGVPRTGYEWTLSRGTQVISGPTTESATATSLTVTAGLVSLGDTTLTLTATGPGQWTSPSITGSISSVLILGTSCSV